jgi:hypothetical protein
MEGLKTEDRECQFHEQEHMLCTEVLKVTGQESSQEALLLLVVCTQASLTEYTLPMEITMITRSTRTVPGQFITECVINITIANCY